ncbi:MAG: DUF4393 domain-containing protein [Deltaproteobacteria bacterium]|nr:MAG: DUF4393 domain-containing protein [Deltaproteobacteria bacterium]
MGTLGRTVNIALAPLRGLLWDEIEAWLAATIERKLEERGVPKERITTPNPDVAVPAIEALRYTRLREQYANLLATSMDSATALEAHPAFVEILKQLTPDEAKILQFLPRVERHEPLIDLGFEIPEKGQFVIYRHASTIGADAGCSSDAIVPQAINNLCRLGLTEIPATRKLAEDWRYDRIRALSVVSEIKAQIPKGARFIIEEKIFGITIMGESFRAACISEHKSAA